MCSNQFCQLPSETLAVNELRPLKDVRVRGTQGDSGVNESHGCHASGSGFLHHLSALKKSLIDPETISITCLS